MLGIVATVKIKEGARAHFEALAEELVALSRNEPGCAGYTLWRTQDELTYAFVEYYKEPSDLDAHIASEHYRHLGGRLREFMSGPPQFTRLLPPSR